VCENQEGVGTKERRGGEVEVEEGGSCVRTKSRDRTEHHREQALNLHTKQSPSSALAHSYLDRKWNGFLAAALGEALRDVDFLTRKFIVIVDILCRRRGRAHKRGQSGGSFLLKRSRQWLGVTHDGCICMIQSSCKRMMKAKDVNVNVTF
jgi:hypothetical protein